jgi:hypothetical protein
MSKGRGGAGKLVRKPAKQLSEVVPITKPSNVQTVGPLTTSVAKPALDRTQLRALRHFRPAHLRTFLSQLRQVGEGRSRLSL